MNGQAGKGDRYRPVDPKKWAKGWARAFGNNIAAALPPAVRSTLRRNITAALRAKP